MCLNVTEGSIDLTRVIELGVRLLQLCEATEDSPLSLVQKMFGEDGSSYCPWVGNVSAFRTGNTYCYF